MNPLPPSARLLLDRYKANETLSASSKARLWANLMQAVARGDQPRVDLLRPTASAERSWLRKAWNQRLGKGAFAAVLVLPTLALAALASRSEIQLLPPASIARAVSAAPSPSPSPSPAPALAAVSEPLRRVPVASESADAAHRPAQNSTANKAVRSAAARPSPRQPTIDGEMRLLNQAQAANLAGDSRRALVLLDEYVQRFPSGRLSDVSTVARLIALCNLGQLSSARREAERFQARYPNSPFKERVSRICAPQAVP